MKRLQWRENGGDSDQDTSLHFAAAAGKHQLLYNSLTLGCDINSTNYMGWTPLMQAARNGQAICVRLLLDFGADVSIKNHFGICALSLAAASGSLETVSLILKSYIQRGIQISDVEEYISPVIFGVIFNHIDIIRYLHKYSYNLNKTIPLGDLSPVVIANILNQKELISYFKRRGIMAVNVQSPLVIPSTPVHNSLFFFKSTPSSCKGTAMLSPNFNSSNIPSLSLTSPMTPANTPFNTPKNNKYSLTPNQNSMLEVRKRRSSNFHVSPTPNTPSLSPIINSCTGMSYNSECSQLASSMVSNVSSNNLMNSRIKPTSLTFSSTSSDNNSFPLLHPNNSKCPKYRSASCNVLPAPITPTATTSEINDEVFHSPMVYQYNKYEFVNLLRRNSLDSCISLFEKHEIDMELFLTLSKSDLEEIGVDWDLRDEILELIYQCNKDIHGDKKRKL